jgi:DNA repair photolyase
LSRKIRYDHIQTKNTMNRVTAPSMPFEWSINPYRGCQHGCSFCYARATHSFLGMATDDTFQNHILLKSNAPEALEAQLRKMTGSRSSRRNVGKVAIGTATDPYQPVEAKAELTRKCLEILAEYQIPVSITTRSPLVLRDIELLRRLPVSSVNISINTLDTSVWKQMEPSTPSPAKRFETVLHLVEEGIPAGIFLAPILPYLTDSTEDLRDIIASAAKHKTQFVMSSFLRLSTSEVKVWFFNTLRQYYPELVEKYAELYQHSAYVPQSYREPVSQQIRALLVEHGLTDIEPFQRKNMASVVKEEGTQENPGPIQLSFGF